MVLKHDKRAELIQEAQDEAIRDSEARFKRRGRDFLSSIASAQARIETYQKDIVQYRKQLAELEIKEVSTDY